MNAIRRRKIRKTEAIKQTVKKAAPKVKTAAPKLESNKRAAPKREPKKIINNELESLLNIQKEVSKEIPLIENEISEVVTTDEVVNVIFPSRLNNIQKRKLKRLQRISASKATVSVAAPGTEGVMYKDDIYNEGMTSFEFEYQPGFRCIVYRAVGNTNEKAAWIAGLHGGGGKPESMQQWANDFTKKGYVYFAPMYREKEGKDDNLTKDEQMEGIANMLNFIDHVRKNAVTFGVKKKKCFFHGISAGAIICIELGIVITLRFMFPTFNQNKMQILGTASNSGAAIPDFQNLIPDAAKIDLIINKKQMPPNAFFNGMLDEIIDFVEAEKTYLLETSNGVPSFKHWFPDQKHKLQNHEIILQEMTDFFFSLLQPIKA
jgi:predicted esterase